VIIIWDYYFRLDHGFSFGLQGRYFFPLVVAHFAILLIGLKTLFEFIFRSFAKWGYLVLISAVLIFNDVSLFFLSTSYYSTSGIEVFARQASQYKPEMIKGLPIFMIVLLIIISQIIFITILASKFKKNEI